MNGISTEIWAGQMVAFAGSAICGVIEGGSEVVKYLGGCCRWVFYMFEFFCGEIMVIQD